MENEDWFNVSAGRTDNFQRTAQAVSEYLQGLPITAEQGNKLRQLITANVAAAETDAFVYGLEVAGLSIIHAKLQSHSVTEKDLTEAAKYLRECKAVKGILV